MSVSAGFFRRAVLPIVFVTAAAALLPGKARAAGGVPRFDCRKASTPVEREICRKPQLADLDNEIASLYAQALSLLDAAGADALRNNQRLWIKVRDDCNSRVPGNPAARSDVEGCLADSMTTRVGELQKVVANRAFVK